MIWLIDGFVRARALVNRVIKGHRLSIDLAPKPFPRIIWMYWAQGLDEAPELVQICVRSWQEKNPGWEVRLITEEIQDEYLDRSQFPEGISHAHLSDILRLYLLRDHGGVWTDATTFCCRPLDHWLPPLMQAGFFTFAWPTPGRIIGNWFMACQPGATPVARLAEQLTRYWQVRSKPSDYFLFHYTFEWLVRTDRATRRVWRDMPKVSPDGAHTIFAAGRAGTVEDGPGPDIDATTIPLFKLSWKEEVSKEGLAKWGVK